MYSYLFFIMFLISCMLSILFMLNDYVILIELNMLSMNSLSIVMMLLFDWMSLLFMSFVLLISSMVIYYSEEYMHGDLNLNRFILLVIMFVLSMMLLIISPNLISILLGWDGLGLVSYVLVIYYQNMKSFNAGMITVLSNRIGDVALLISIAWMMNYGSWSYYYYLEIFKNDLSMQIISSMVILAAMTKSAQIPFSSWLPAAMAAPTPVSSLVHSSTLVTAGVYLLIRFNMSFSLNMMYFLLLISCLTMFMSGLGANFEIDLKKIIALSTLSQLGLMISILALGSYKLSFLHLLTHALFKALLFMCAGNIIHNFMNYQDIRFMGGLVSYMPITISYLMICNFALCGLPFLSGFYSKDLIGEVLSMMYLNMFIYLMFYVSIGLTVSYSFRLMYYVLVGNLNFKSMYMMYESKNEMIKSMSNLILLMIFSGSTLIWLIYPIPYFIILPFVMKCMTLLMVMMGAFLGYQLSKFQFNYEMKTLKFNKLISFLALMWNMPFISTLGVNYLPIWMGEIYSKLFDQGWIEYYSAKNLKYCLINQSQFLQIFYKNHLKIYMMMFIIWILFLYIM
uniref:NADH-ubiquinone oxidoreductase chain 5 n=1 Tax=Coleoptera sp. ACP-2013 TaxID=2485033 RepID=A0A3G3MEP7_9COLE|nr:NADH dehydrogenase subunit 5 [Coleoptera sp. ACP-2013]